MSRLLKRINWTNLLFLTITPIVAITGLVFIIVTSQIYWQTIILALVFLALSGLSITAGYHRLFSHLSYKAAWPVRLFFALFGAATFQGSVLEWCTDHRAHHRYTDTDRDPYSIKKGFWYAHIGWLFVLDFSARDFSNIEDLMQDPILRWQYKYYVYIATFMGFILPMLIGALWHDALGGLIIAGALRMTLNHHATFCINSVCHIFGKRTYSDRQSAVDNWVTALFTYGEGFHNFHHQFPLDYRNGIRIYHYDPTKWLIRVLAFLGLAKDLKRVASHRIIRYRLRMDQKRLIPHATPQNFERLLEQMSHVMKPVYEKIQHLLRQLEELEKGYEELKKNRIHAVKDKMQEYRQNIHEYRQQMKLAQKELRRMLAVWTHLQRTSHLQSDFSL